MTDPSEGLSFGDAHTDPEVEWPDWNGWTDDAPVSPFEKNRERLLLMDDVPPEMEVPGHQEARSERWLFGADITQDQGTLRVEALEFKPGAVHLRQPVTVLAKELDKLTISGFLAAKRLRSNRRSSVSDFMTRDIFRRGPGHVRPASVPARSGQSRGGSSPLGSEHGYEHARRSKSN